MPRSSADELKPVIIIGAARSGTKLLRGILAATAGVSVVPYDVNYIWRTGNEAWGDDCLPPDSCTPQIAARIRKALTHVAVPPSGPHRPILIEKSVSNALRVPFVERVFPDAHYVHLLRDGRDVVDSAMKCWIAPPDPAYLLRKMLHFPLRNLGYGVKYLRNMASARARYGRAQRVWGPQYPGIDVDAEHLDLLTICAKQWSACVRMALDAFQHVDERRVSTLQFERLARDPEVINWLCARIGVRDAAPAVTAWRAAVNGDPNHVSAKHLDNTQQRRLEALLGPTLQAAGYSSA